MLWEAQRRGLLADSTLTTEQLTAICDGDGAGSAEWLAEQIMRSSVARTAAASARAIRALAENETLAPGRLISHALHALGPLDNVRARWQTANGHPAPAPPPAPPTEGPPTAQVHAALARSTARPAARPSECPGSASTSSAARPPSRTHG